MDYRHILPRASRIRLGAFAVGVAALSLAVLPQTVAGQGPPPVVREAVGALMGMLESGDETSARSFADERLSEAYETRLGDGAVAYFRSLQTETRGALGNVGVERSEDGSLMLNLSGPSGRASLRLLLDTDTGRFDDIELLDVSEGSRAGPGGGGAPEGRAGAVQDHLRALELLTPDDAQVSDFRRRRMSPTLRSRPEIPGLLRTVARAASSAGAVGVDGDGPYHVLSLRGGLNATVRIRVGDARPFLIEELTVDTTGAASGEGSAAPVEPLPWRDLEATLAAAVDWGFSGTVLAVRDGQIVHHQGYGFADRESGRPNDVETVYDIGSQPIDFTRAAIWLLVQRGELSMDDAVSRFYPDAPADKRGITLRHLMEGSSGLPNFHHRASDEDWDLSWIEREMAEERILNASLLFEPGSNTALSHSAFGLLAAIVERVSGQAYEDFLEVNFFEPVGMERTGPYGDDLGLPESAFAVGYGDYAASEPNIPPEWGRTSWLIKGSGGMVSTPLDLYRFFEAMRSGEILRGAAREGYLQRGSSTGATDRGFLFVHAWPGGDSDSMVLFTQNALPDHPESRVLRRRLAAMVQARLIS